MNTEGYKKTELRHSGGGVSKAGDGAEKMPEFGGLGSPEGPGVAAAGAGQVRGQGVVEVIVDAEAPGERGRGAPKKAGRARKDALRAYAAALGAEPGELLLETVMGGLQAYLERGGELQHWLAARAKQIARANGMSRAAAFGMLQKMLGDLMPYTHQKLPQAIEVEGGEIVFGVVLDGRLQPARGGTGAGLDLRPANVRRGPEMVSISDKSGGKSDGISRTDGGEV